MKMELFYIITTLCLVENIICVHGLHSNSPANAVRSYQSPRILTRPGPRTLFQTRSAYSEALQRRQPPLRPFQTFQRLPINPRAVSLYSDNYQTQFNRNIVRPRFPLSPNRPVILPPRVHFHRGPTASRPISAAPNAIFIPNIQEGIQPVTLKTQSDIARTFFTGQDSQQKKENTLLTLLDERRPVIRDESDIFLLRKHLVELNRIGSMDNLNKDRILEKQVEYMEEITDEDIQREVLKIFVKDMIEKSGFLNDSSSNAQDIDVLVSLIDRISSVANKFTNRRHIPGKNSSREKSINVTDPSVGKERSQNSNDRTNSSLENDLRNRILNALTVYEKRAHSSYTGRQPKPRDKGAQNFQSRPSVNQVSSGAWKPSPGMSIFGETGAEPTHLRDQTTELKRDSITTEPLGGDNAYWTHLRAGLVDLLCSLCRQRQHESCIVRYCSNDVIRTETETPSPVVAQTVT